MSSYLTSTKGTQSVNTESLQAAFEGAIITPASPTYNLARKIWNGMIDRHPALIAQCNGVADVQAAVRFAREHDLLVAIKAGGHNVAGTAVCDGGMVIDLSPMKGMRVDPAARTAWAEPGLLWGEFDHETQAFGLATTGGIVTHTGMAGLTLGGGIGWLMRKHGLSCDNLLEADVVTADGEFLKASEQENADLFWGIRGGGGNFGIVTNFKFRLHPVGPEVLAGPILYPAEQAQEVLEAYRDAIANAPDELGTIVNLRHAPPAPWLPESVHGQPVVLIAVCYAGPVDEAKAVIAPFHKLGTPIANAIRPMPYTTLQGMFDASVPHGLHYYWKSHYSASLSNDAIRTLAALAWKTKSPSSYTIIFHMGGAVRHVSEEATAFKGRTALHAINVNAAWRPDFEAGREDIQWTQELWSALAPYSDGGVYMNFLGDEGQDRVKAAYGAATYERLVALKDKYDPTNFFRMNQNIKPTV
jgi:FAD/FMN-containing dehydrogenase